MLNANRQPMNESLQTPFRSIKTKVSKAGASIVTRLASYKKQCLQEPSDFVDWSVDVSSDGN